MRRPTNQSRRPKLAVKEGGGAGGAEGGEQSESAREERESVFKEAEARANLAAQLLMEEEEEANMHEAMRKKQVLTYADVC